VSSDHDHIVVYVWDDELIVTMPGSNFKAVYHKPVDQLHIVAKHITSGTQVQGARVVGGLSEGAIDWVDLVTAPLRELRHRSAKRAPERIMVTQFLGTSQSQGGCGGIGPFLNRRFIVGAIDRS
jgi:hypothetical protein